MLDKRLINPTEIKFLEINNKISDHVLIQIKIKIQNEILKNEERFYIYIYHLI